MDEARRHLTLNLTEFIVNVKATQVLRNGKMDDRNNRYNFLEITKVILESHAAYKFYSRLKHTGGSELLIST